MPFLSWSGLRPKAIEIGCHGNQRLNMSKWRALPTMDVQRASFTVSPEIEKVLLELVLSDAVGICMYGS